MGERPRTEAPRYNDSSHQESAHAPAQTPEHTLTLQDLGWNDFFASFFAPYAEQGLVPARVVAQKGLTQVSTGEAEHYAELAGKLRHELKGPGGASGHPAVGDWLALRPPTGEGRAMIHAVLPRKSKFSRKTAGQRTEEQVVAANIDTIFLVSGLDGDFNPRRIERYLTAAWDARRSAPAPCARATTAAGTPPPIASCSWSPPAVSSSTPRACGSSSS